MGEKYFVVLVMFFLIGIVEVSGISESELNEGVLVELKVGESINFNIFGENQYVFLDKVNVFGAELRVSSDENAVFNIGNSREFDLNKDDEKDLRIRLNSVTITSNKESAELFIKVVENRNNLDFLLGIIGLIIIILIFAFYLHKLKFSSKITS